MPGAGALLAQRLGRLRSLGLGDVLREAARLRAALAVPIFRLSRILRIPPAYVWAAFAVMFCTTALAVSWVLTALLLMLLNRKNYIAAMERGKGEAQSEWDGWSEEEADGEEQGAGDGGGDLPNAPPGQLVPSSPVAAQQTVKGSNALTDRPKAGGGPGFQPAASTAAHATAAVAPPAAQVQGLGSSGISGILALLREAETDEEKEVARLARHYATVRPTAVHEVCRLLSGALGVQLGSPAAVAGLMCSPAGAQHAVLGRTVLQARLTRHVYGKLYGSGSGSTAVGGDGSVSGGTGENECVERPAGSDAAGEGKGVLRETGRGRGRGRDVDAEVVCRVVAELLQDGVVCRVGRQMRMDVLLGAARELQAAEAAEAEGGGEGAAAAHGKAAGGHTGQEGQADMQVRAVELSESEALMSLVWVADGADERAGRRAAGLLVALACELKLFKGV